jgi:hypothetical protein
MSGLADRIRYALVNPLRDDHAIDPMRELANLLREVGLEPESGGGAVTFAGRDPIVSSPLPFATWRRLRLWRRPCRWRSYGGSGAAKVRIFRSASVRPYIGYVLSTTRNGNC